MRSMLIRGARALLGPEFELSPAPVDVLVRGEWIEAIEPPGTIGGADEVIALPGRLLTPGLINGHLHSHEHFQRGRTENLPLEIWQMFVRTPKAIPFTPRQVYLRTLLGAIECLRSGATCVVDDLRVRAGDGDEYLDAVFQAYEDVGIRALVGFAMMDRNIIDTFPRLDLLPPALLERMRAVPVPSGKYYLDLVRGLARSRHPASRRVSVLVSASAPHRCTESFLRACRELADEFDLPVITHVHETRMQVVTGMEFYGKPMVEYLDSVGFLKPKTSLIHAVWLNPREIAALARSGASAQHNPWSNLMLGSGVQPVRELLDAGVNVSMGSDGSCSTVTVNMLTVLGTAAAISKVRGDGFSKWLTAQEALAAATTGGARALGFENSLGVLRPGARADVTGYRTDTVTFMPLNNAVRQLVYAERGSGLEFAMVSGEVVMREGILQRIDEAAVLREIEAEMEALQAEITEGERSGAELRDAMRVLWSGCLSEHVPTDTYPARLDDHAGRVT